MASAITAHAGTACHGKAAFFAAHALKPGFMFGASVAMRHADGRIAHAQSGCLSYGSPLTNQQRQSATCQRQVVARPSAGNRHHVPRHLSACLRQVGRASFGARRTEFASPCSTRIRQNLWQSKSIHGGAFVQSTSINNHGATVLLLPSVPPLGSLTGRCSRRSITGSLRQRLMGAAELGR